MSGLVLAVHIIVAIFLILVVLLQAGKGASIGATFGSGSSQTVFGSRGPASFLSKLTTAAAATFMITSLVLAIATSSERQSSVVEDMPVQTAPAEEQQAAEPEKTEQAAEPAVPADEGGFDPFSDPAAKDADKEKSAE